MRKKIFLLFFSIGFSLVAQQKTIVVLDSVSGFPIDGVQLQYDGKTFHAGKDGKISFPLGKETRGMLTARYYQPKYVDLKRVSDTVFMESVISLTDTLVIEISTGKAKKIKIKKKHGPSAYFCFDSTVRYDMFFHITDTNLIGKYYLKKISLSLSRLRRFKNGIYKISWYKQKDGKTELFQQEEQTINYRKDKRLDVFAPKEFLLDGQPWVISFEVEEAVSAKNKKQKCLPFNVLGTSHGIRKVQGVDVFIKIVPRTFPTNYYLIKSNWPDNRSIKPVNMLLFLEKKKTAQQ